MHIMFIWMMMVLAKDESSGTTRSLLKCAKCCQNANNNVKRPYFSLLFFFRALFSLLTPITFRPFTQNGLTWFFSQSFLWPSSLSWFDDLMLCLIFYLSWRDNRLPVQGTTKKLNVESKESLLFCVLVFVNQAPL